MSYIFDCWKSWAYCVYSNIKRQICVFCSLSISSLSYKPTLMAVFFEDVLTPPFDLYTQKVCTAYMRIADIETQRFCGLGLIRRINKLLYYFFYWSIRMKCLSSIVTVFTMCVCVSAIFFLSQLVCVSHLCRPVQTLHLALRNFWNFNRFLIGIIAWLLLLFVCASIQITCL